MTLLRIKAANPCIDQEFGEVKIRESYDFFKIIKNSFTCNKLPKI